MEARSVLLFFLLRGIVFTAAFAADEDSTYRSAYFTTRKNKRLKGCVVKRFESLSFVSCSQSCLRNPWCSSINFKVSSENDSKGTCELNKHDSSLINDNTKFHNEEGTNFSMLLKVGYSVLIHFNLSGFVYLRCMQIIRLIVIYNLKGFYFWKTAKLRKNT